LQLAVGMTVLTGLTVYDTIATVRAVATYKSIRLFIDIPLRAADRYFELYKVHSLPFFRMGINRFIIVENFFAIMTSVCYLIVFETCIKYVQQT
jgi:hypothetical protein